jgi:hypothetical protein
MTGMTDRVAARTLGGGGVHRADDRHGDDRGRGGDVDGVTAASGHHGIPVANRHGIDSSNEPQVGHSFVLDQGDARIKWCFGHAFSARKLNLVALLQPRWNFD